MYHLGSESPARVAQNKATRLSSGQFREKKTKESKLRGISCFLLLRRAISMRLTASAAHWRKRQLSRADGAFGENLSPTRRFKHIPDFKITGLRSGQFA